MEAEGVARGCEPEEPGRESSEKGGSGVCCAETSGNLRVTAVGVSQPLFSDMKDTALAKNLRKMRGTGLGKIHDPG